ncbi:MAG: hypothetical protein ACJAYU_004393 [Bradymonadia bacterium]|jgi:hypothetical protein
MPASSMTRIPASGPFIVVIRLAVAASKAASEIGLPDVCDGHFVRVQE